MGMIAWRLTYTSSGASATVGLRAASCAPETLHRSALFAPMDCAASDS